METVIVIIGIIILYGIIQLFNFVVESAEAKSDALALYYEYQEVEEEHKGTWLINKTMDYIYSGNKHKQKVILSLSKHINNHD